MILKDVCGRISVKFKGVGTLNKTLTNETTKTFQTAVSL